MMQSLDVVLTSVSDGLVQMSKGITVKDVSSHEFVVSYAAHLKKQGKIQLPELVDLMKTGIFKELAPYNDDWFYVRCGACL
jgi:small subunit ribosomal protein S19e